MTETVVHVTTIEEWKSVLDVWFKQGHKWRSEGDQGYHEGFYCGGSRQLGFNVRGLGDINYWSGNDYTGDNLIEYSEFMSQQKEGNKMETYYVTREQYDLIEELYGDSYPLDELLYRRDEARKLFGDFAMAEGKAVLRYLGDDASIEFLVKDPLYQLWRIDNADDKVYMRFNLGNPDWTLYEEGAFTAPLEEIKKWQTPAWDIEEVN